MTHTEHTPVSEMLSRAAKNRRIRELERNNEALIEVVASCLAFVEVFNSVVGEAVLEAVEVGKVAYGLCIALFQGFE